MKKITAQLILYLFFFTSTSHGMIFFAGKPVISIVDCADTTCDGFIICQNFEGTGYDNSETWSENIGGTGVVDEDDTTAPVGRESQQLKVIGDSTASSYSSASITITSDLWFHFMVKVSDSTPSSVSTILNCNGGAFTLTLMTDGTLRLLHGSSLANTSASQLSDNTYKHIWIHFVAGATDGIYQLYISDTEVRPVTPSIDENNGTRSTGLNIIELFSSRDYASGTFFDQVLVSDTEIGDVCE